MARKALSSLIVGTLVAVLAIVNASSASAAENRFQGVNTNLCLDGYASRDVRGIGDLYVTDCNTGGFQKWTWYAGTTGIRSRAENKCIEWNGGETHLVTCRAVSGQFWVVSLPYIKKANSTNYCLTRLGGRNSGVIVERCDSGDLGQRWRIA